MLLGIVVSVITFIVAALSAIQSCAEKNVTKRRITFVILGICAVAIIVSIKQCVYENEEKSKSNDVNNAITGMPGNSESKDDNVQNSERDITPKSNDENLSADTQPAYKSQQSNIMDVSNNEVNYSLLNSMFRMQENNIHIDKSAITTWGDEWTDCMRLGSSNLNADGISYIQLPCKGEYSRFTAEIAAENGFDSYETVTVTIYGVDKEGSNIDLGESYEIGINTKPFIVDCDISQCDILVIYKNGNYSMGRIAGQFLNGYTGMSVLIRDGILYKK